MTPIGLTSAECRGALEHYRSAVLGIASALSARSVDSVRELVAYSDLMFELEVDVRARCTVEGQARMSPVERALFEPIVRELRTALVEATACSRVHAVASLEWRAMLLGDAIARTGV